jgi:hypothetical protein
MKITEEYRELNKQLHETNEHYGTSGQKYAQMIMGLASAMGIDKILDYGAGKCTLAKSMPQFQVTNHDPCVPGLETEPEPHKLVVCTDVLEHIEPDCLKDVLEHLYEVTEQILFLEVATRPAKKTLADGRNTHLIVEPAIWWLNELDDYGFRCDNLQNSEGAQFIGTFTKVPRDGRQVQDIRRL